MDKILLGISLGLILILFILTIALILNADFRKDVINSATNEGEANGIKLKGTLFWMLYASTLIVTYLIVNMYFNKVEVEIEAMDPNAKWIAYDITNGTPTALNIKYFNRNDTIKEPSELNTSFKLIIDTGLVVKQASSGYELGKIIPESMTKMGFSGLKIKNYTEIYYDLELSPIFKEKINLETNTRRLEISDYYELPFEIKLDFSFKRQVYCTIFSEIDQDTYLNKKTNKKDTLSLKGNWIRRVELNDRIFLVRLRSKAISKNSGIKPHANFQFVEFFKELD